MVVLLAVYGFVLGAALASFGCVVSERVPRGEPITGRSHCVCGRQLRVSENVPVLGWWRARHGAACCGARLPVRYVACEVAVGAVGAAAGALVGRTLLSGGPVPLAGGAALLVLLMALTGMVALTWQRPTRRD